MNTAQISFLGEEVNWDSSWYDKYINNFNNIVNEDAGVQQSLNLRMDCCV